MSVSANPFGPIQEAVVDLLRADPELSSRAAIFDFVPEDEQSPYVVVFSSAWLAERDNLASTVDRVWFQIDVWSKYRGYHEVNEIGAMVERVLRRVDLDMDGYDPVRVQMIREQSHLTRDPGNVWRRLALTFNCPYVSPAAEAVTA